MEEDIEKGFQVMLRGMKDIPAIAGEDWQCHERRSTLAQLWDVDIGCTLIKTEHTVHPPNVPVPAVLWTFIDIV